MNDLDLPHCPDMNDDDDSGFSVLRVLFICVFAFFAYLFNNFLCSILYPVYIILAFILLLRLSIHRYYMATNVREL